MWLGVLGISVGGFLLKVVDWSGDLATLKESQTWLKVVAIVTACLCGFILSFVSSFESGFLIVISGVVLGALLAGKVDNLYLLLGLIVLILGWIWLGSNIPLGEISLLPIFAIAFGGLFDEMGNNLADKNVIHGLAGSFFQYRGILKILVIVLWILDMVSLWGAIGLWVFDVGYLLAELLLSYPD